MTPGGGRGQVILRLATGEGAEELDVDGAVFDCDGLLVDSESIWLQMIREWLDEWGVQDEPENYLGLSVDDTAERLSAARGEASSRSRLTEELTARYSGLLAGGVSPMPGAVELVTSLARRIPVAVASNGLRHDVRSMLGESPLLGAAHTVCTLEDVAVGKPAPDLYLAACDRLGLEPRRAVAFEDSPAGARAALAAGLAVVGVNPDVEVELPVSLRLRGLDQVSICSSATLNHTDSDSRGVPR